MTTRIEYLRLENRVYNALLKADIDFVEKLIKLSSVRLERVRGIGSEGVKEIKAKMKKYGYEVRPLTVNTQDGWGFSKLVPKNEKNRSGGVSSRVRT